MLCGLSYSASHPEDELIRNPLLPTPPRSWRNRAGGQLKTLAMALKEDLEPSYEPRVFDCGRHRGSGMVVFSEFSQYCRAWCNSIRYVVNSNGYAGSTHPERMSPQLQVGTSLSLSFSFFKEHQTALLRNDRLCVLCSSW